MSPSERIKSQAKEVLNICISIQNQTHFLCQLNITYFQFQFHFLSAFIAWLNVNWTNFTLLMVYFAS